MATLAPSILVVVHSFLGYSDCSPVGPLVGQGIAYSGFAAVIWPCIPIVVPEHLLGLAYGAVFSILSAGLAVFPLLISLIYADNGKHYIPAVELFFVVVAVIGVFVGIYLNYHDYFHINSKLNNPNYQAAVNDRHGSIADGYDSHEGQATSNSYALINPPQDSVDIDHHDARNT